MLEQFRLDGKTAIVTGIGPGIGSHVALAYANAGANVVACARTATRVQALVDEIEAAGGKAVGVVGDVGVKDDLDRLVKACNDRFGGADILFYNAAAGSRSSGATTSLDLSEDDWAAAVNVNLLGPFRLAQAVVPGMKARGAGAIVTVLTTAAFAPVVTLPLAAYGATKAGLAMLTRYLAKECGPEVRANSICPGTIAADEESAGLRAAQPAWAPLMDNIPLGRVGLADEVVGTALYLASDASSYVTGQVVFVDGGRVNTMS